MDKTNIVLIGMPGAGKSTVGVLLAKTLGKCFLDTDLVIQEREGKLLQDIINKDGIEYFSQAEEAAILEINVRNQVIATGGSVVYSEQATEHLRQYGTVVYLQVDFKDLEKRIRNITTRGIAMNEGQTLIDLYSERVPLYEKYAGITIHCSGKHVEQIVEEICSLLEEG